MEQITGLVERVTFHSPESGFCVLRVKARGQRDLVTIVGHAPSISPGEYITAGGTWLTDRDHGLQFRATFLRVTPTTTLEGIEKYLGSGMIRGIGPNYSRRLVQAFGETVFEIIEQKPHRLRLRRRRGAIRIEPAVGMRPPLAKGGLQGATASTLLARSSSGYPPQVPP